MGFDKLQSIIVLYRTSASDSVAVQSLLRAASSFPETLHLLLYDNSPTPSSPISNDWPGIKVEYRHDPRNEGLATAYNVALQTAKDAQRTWLLLLDQDTRIEPTFLATLKQQLDSEPPLSVSAIVPRLQQGDIRLSPSQVTRWREIQLDPAFRGIANGYISALNSGACLRVAALETISGFPSAYPLDYLDHAVFDRLQRAGGRVLVLDCTLEHRLSLLNLSEEMSSSRYKSLLHAEKRFVAESKSILDGWIYRARLLKRAWNQLTQQQSAQHAWLTLKAVFFRSG
jgi:GT2 family glycosyltransferase